MSAIPKTPLDFDPAAVKPQWQHPYLSWVPGAQPLLKKKELTAFVYDYYLKFLPFFRNQPEGSLQTGVQLKFTARMRHKLGQAELFSQQITLNERYFAGDPRLLPYSLFHEMVHLWLYDCHLDPGHTQRFYRKMSEFLQTGLPVDPDVHIHRRRPQEAKFVYLCDGCGNRWYVQNSDSGTMSCGYCDKFYGRQSYPKLHPNGRAFRELMQARV